jgi:hypothetical protein
VTTIAPPRSRMSRSAQRRPRNTPHRPDSIDTPMAVDANADRGALDRR